LDRVLEELVGRERQARRDGGVAEEALVERRHEVADDADQGGARAEADVDEGLLAVRGGHQQILGNASPKGKSRMRSPPIAVRTVTKPGWAATTRPMRQASRPSGCARSAASTRSAPTSGTRATSLPSLATRSGSRPKISQAPRTASLIGTTVSSTSTPSR